MKSLAVASCLIALAAVAASGSHHGSKMGHGKKKMMMMKKKLMSLMGQTEFFPVEDAENACGEIPDEDQIRKGDPMKTGCQGVRIN